MAESEMLDAMKDIICETGQRTSKNTIILIESEFATKFDLLAEGQKTILDKIRYFHASNNLKYEFKVNE